MMAWFKRKKQKVTTTQKKSIPDGLWEKCPKCDEILFKKELSRVLMVCPNCQFVQIAALAVRIPAGCCHVCAIMRKVEAGEVRYTRKQSDC